MATTDLSALDPVFIEVCKMVYGDADPREIWDIAKMGDSSEVHVNGASDKVSVGYLRHSQAHKVEKVPGCPYCKVSVKKNAGATSDKDRKKLAGGLLFGAGAESLAVKGAFTAARKAPKTTVGEVKTAFQRGPGVGSGVQRAVRTLAHSKQGKVAELGIQGANMAIGLGAAHELVKKPKAPVAKRKIPLPHTNPEALRASNGRARRNGLRLVGATASAASGGAGYGLGRRRAATVPPVSTVAKADKRENVHRAGVTANGIAGSAGATFGAAKLRDSFSEQYPEHAARGLQHLKGGRHAVPGLGSKVAHVAEHGKPGFKLAVTAGAVGGVGAGLHRYGQHMDRVKAKRQHQAVAKGLVDVEVFGTISKVNEEKRQVFGWANLSVVDGKPVVDLQGDYVDIEEIEKSAYSYVLSSRVGGDMHARISKLATAPRHTADMIESVVITPEKLEAWNLAPDALPLGWWVGYHVNDDQQWEDVKLGKRLGFSIHGSGTRVPMGVSKKLDEGQRANLRVAGTVAGAVALHRGHGAARAGVALHRMKNADRAAKLTHDLSGARSASMSDPNPLAQKAVARRVGNKDAKHLKASVNRYSRSFQEAGKMKRAANGRTLNPERALHTKVLTSLVDNAKVGQHPRLARSQHMSEKHNRGDVVDFGRLSSWSSDRGMAEKTGTNLEMHAHMVGALPKALQHGSLKPIIKPGMHQAIYHLPEGTARAANISGATGQFRQNEWLVGGKYKVTGIQEGHHGVTHYILGPHHGPAPRNGGAS